jgi:RNA polymerase sigma-70 factor (ECF subfamily)
LEACVQAAGRVAAHIRPLPAGAMTKLALSPSAVVYANLHGELLSFVYRKVRSSAIAADIVQDAYLRATASLQDQAPDDPRAYLYRVAENLTVDHLRRQRARGKYLVEANVSEEQHPKAPSPETQLIDRQRLQALVAAVDELPRRCREVFMLRKFEDLNQSEIAHRLGISRNMVEKHLRHALSHCRKRLNDAENG